MPALLSMQKGAARSPGRVAAWNTFTRQEQREMKRANETSLPSDKTRLRPPLTATRRVQVLQKHTALRPAAFEDGKLLQETNATTKGHPMASWRRWRGASVGVALSNKDIPARGAPDTKRTEFRASCFRTGCAPSALRRRTREEEAGIFVLRGNVALRLLMPEPNRPPHRQPVQHKRRARAPQTASGAEQAHRESRP